MQTLRALCTASEFEIATRAQAAECAHMSGLFEAVVGARGRRGVRYFHKPEPFQCPLPRVRDGRLAPEGNLGNPSAAPYRPGRCRWRSSASPPWRAFFGHMRPWVAEPEKGAGATKSRGAVGKLWPEWPPKPPQAVSLSRPLHHLARLATRAPPCKRNRWCGNGILFYVFAKNSARKNDAGGLGEVQGAARGGMRLWRL